MRILHLGLQGFGAYKTETKIDFTEINQAVILGENGAGKSTLIDGIAFALFGVTRTRQLDEMISTGGEKAVASLVFLRLCVHVVVFLVKVALRVW